jgi:hypothetical protein
VTTLTDHTRDALRSYLRTAIAFDDRFSMDEPDVIGEVSEPTGRIDDDSIGLPSAADAPLVVEHLVRGFAQLGVVCAVHNPVASGNEKERLSSWYVDLARDADITVVDWKIADHDDGALALDLIERLTEDAAELQIVVVYTGHAADADVSEKLDSCDALRRTGSELVWTASATVVFLLGKADVDAEHLPAKVLDLLAVHLSGILRVVGLRAAASLRAKLPAVLNLFTRDLDAGLLSHGIMTDVEDTRVFANAIVADEIIEVAMSPGANADLFTAEALSGFAYEAFEGPSRPTALPGDPAEAKRGGPAELRTLKSDTLVEILGIHPGQCQDFAERVQKTLFSSPADQPKWNWMKKVAEGRLTSAFVNGGKGVDRQLAALAYTADGWPRPPVGTSFTLGPGTVIAVHAEGKDEELLVCISPECDCVRLYVDTSFWFVTAVSALEGALDRGPEFEGGRLAPDTKFQNLRQVRFKPDLNDHVVRLAGPTPATLMDPMAVGGVEVTVKHVSRLKPAHTRKLRSDLAQNGARIGLVDYEPSRGS